MLLLFGIVVIAFNLRPAITSIGPVISLIRDDLNISNGVAGLITTLPLLSFATLSILAPKIGRILGNEKAVFVGLLFLTAGILIRSYGIETTLFIGTLLVGVGVAIGNVLLPSIVKMNFPTKVGLVTSIYTTSMNLFAGLGSGVSFPLANGLGLGWRGSLVFWSALALIAILVWLPQLKRTTLKGTTGHNASRTALWISPLAWQVTVFMGLQSFLFYSTVAWLPEIIENQGIPLSIAGWMLLLMQLVGLPATFLAPIIASRYQNQIGMVLAVGIIHLIGVIGLLIDVNNTVLIISIICLGIAQGASISLALTIISLRSTNATQAAMLSGMAQSIGYLLAATGPILIGFVYDQTLSWTIPLLVLGIVTIIMTISGIGAGRNQFVTQPTTAKVS